MQAAVLAAGLVALAAFAPPLGAQARVAPAWTPATGDEGIDRALADINDYARRYPDAFVDELVRYHGAPRAYVEALLGEGGWMPGDVWYACAVAQVVGRSCRYVADEWRAHPGEGWGALAQRLGVAPGSGQFRQLKDGFAPAYARWARPLPASPASPRAKKKRK
jgi:hypothetical protein